MVLEKVPQYLSTKKEGFDVEEKLLHFTYASYWTLHKVGED